MNNASEAMTINNVESIFNLREPNITIQRIESIDIINLEIPIIVPLKRGRGRPRKYPIKESTSVLKKIKPKKLVIRSKPRPIPDLLELTKEPGMPSVWGHVKKGKRVHKFRSDRRSGKVKIEEAESGLPSLDESDSTDYGSLSTDSRSESDSKATTPAAEERLPWLSRIVIPGPIPDLDTLMRDHRLFSSTSDFFSDIPICEDWELYVQRL